jgi:hypothetical protein
LNCAFTGALTREASPRACCQVEVAEPGAGEGVARADGEAAPVADGDGLVAPEEEGLAEADGDAVADGVARRRVRRDQPHLAELQLGGPAHL